MPITLETSALHPATASCLEALQWLHSRHTCHNILEIGCGNGILSLTASALWKTNVLAADISPQAVEDAQRQCNAHKLAGHVTIIRSDGFQHKQIQERTPYDLIICNLLAEPIMQWAPQMKTHIAAGGSLLLAGILAWLAPALEEAYVQRGFEVLHRIERSPWVTIVFSDR